MLDFIKPKPGISVDAQIGKENEMVTGVKAEGETFAWENSAVTIAPESIEGEAVVVGKGVVADTISQQGDVVASTIENYTVEASLPLIFLVLLIVGWLAPTPTRIFHIVRGWWK